MKPDCELLRRYAQVKSEDAFAELVRRHLDLVYSAALRQVNGDAHLAQDVAQTVFTDLARKAAVLSHRPVLTGWLYTSTYFAAAKAVRTERRRHAHEQEAQAMHEILQAPTPDFDWEKLRPMLDQVMHELKESDRDLILMRYFENRPLANIGERLGLSEDAARKRVDRALEKLRGFLSKRGVTIEAAALVVVITANAVQSAPYGLAVAISGAATLAGTAVQTSTAMAATKSIAMTTLQKTLIAASIVASLGTGLYEARQVSHLRGEVQTVQQQHAPLTEQIAQLSRQRDDSLRQLAALRDENERLNRNSAELFKLRGEVARLRASTRELAQTKGDNTREGDQTETALRYWLDRAKQFKALPGRMPDKSIPELQLLNDEDWLKMAKPEPGASDSEVNLADESAARKVLREARNAAKEKLLPLLVRALRGYTEANDGQLPADMLQLKPYFERPLDGTALQRYEILQTGKYEDVPPDLVILAEKAPVDTQYDTRLEVGKYWTRIDTQEAYSPEYRTRSRPPEYRTRSP